MPKIFSRHLAAVSYGGVVIRPGVNTLSDGDMRKLMDDPNAERHAHEGALRIMRDDPPAAPPPAAPPPAAPPPAAPPPAAVAGSRDRKPKESDKAYTARMALLDEEAARADAKADADKVFLTAYNAMTPDEQAAMYVTLTDPEKVLVDSHREVKNG